MKKVIQFFCAAWLFAAGSLWAADDLRISYVRSPFNLQIMVMKERHLLEEQLKSHKVGVQWLEITSGAKQAQALASGDIDIGGVMNTTSVLMANGEGNPVRVVAGVARPTDVFALVSASVKDVKGLKGKAIAGPKGTVLHQLLVAALAKEGMTINDVNFIQMDIPNAFAALQGKSVDAALLAANHVIKAEKMGATILTTATGLVTPVLVMTSSEKFLKDHPERVKAVVAAHDAAWAWIEANPKEALALGAKVQNITLEEAKKLYDWSHFTQRIKASDLESMGKDLQFMLDNKMMRNRVDVKSVVLPEALALQKSEE